jgi:hypothetical protein
MSPGGLLQLAALDQLLVRIDARGFEQAVLRLVAADIGADERLRDQVGERVDDVVAQISRDRARRFRRESAREDRQALQDQALCVR